MRNKTVIFFIVLIFSVIVYTISILRYFGATNFITLTSVLMLATLWILGFLFLRKCLYWYTDFMFNDKTTFVKKVDRPRVYLFSLLFPVLVAIYYIIRNVSHDIILEDASGIMQIVPVVYFSVLLCLNVTFAILLFFSVSKKFEQLYLPVIKDTVDNISKPQNTIKPERVGVIFDALVEKEYLTYADINQQQFDRAGLIDIFTQKKLPERPLCKLEMNNIQTKYFFKCLKKEIPAFTLEGYAGIFGNINGYPSYKSISSSAGNAEKTSYRSDEYQKEIETFFNGLDKP